MNEREEKTMTLKKIIQTSDFTNGGNLNAAQVKKFITFTVDESVVTKMARFKMMDAPIDEVSRLHIGERVAVPKTEAVAPTAGQYVAASGSKVRLTAEAIVVPWEISEKEMQNNVEGEKFEETLMKDIAAALANDLEDLGINGDTTSADTFLALQNGWIEAAKADTLAPAVETTTTGLTNKYLNKTVFSKMMKAIDTKYRRRRKDMIFMVNSDDEQDYRLSLTGRDTSLGDIALVGNENLKIYGVEIVPVPTLAQGTALLTLKNNLIWGWWKEMRMLRDQDIYKDTRQFAIHLNVAYAVEKGEAMVIMTGITEWTT
jgi:hypothetical protein